MEESDVLRFTRRQLGQEDGIGVRLAAVIILAVAGQPSQEHTLILLVPVVYGKHDVTLLDSPRIGQGGDERAVDHIPELTVVLLLLVDDRIEHRTALTYRKRSEFGKQVRFLDVVLIAPQLYLRNDLLGHVFVIVFEIERVLDRETAADIQAVEFGTHLLQFAIDVDTFAQLVPVVCRILNTGIDEEVKQLELELLVGFDLLLVEVDDIVVTDSEARGIEVELGLLLGCDPDTNVAASGQFAVE